MEIILLDLLNQYIQSYAGYSIFYHGWYGIFFTSVIMYIFNWIYGHGKTKTPNEDIIGKLAPSYVVALSLAIFGFPPFFTGLAMMIVYMLKMRDLDKMQFLPFIRFALYLFLALGIGFFIDPIVGLLWTVILLFICYLTDGISRTKADAKAKMAKK